MRIKSSCCNADTRIGYFNPDNRRDIYGVIYKNSSVAFGIMGTYCKTCDKLCDYTKSKKEYYTNGLIKLKP